MRDVGSVGEANTPVTPKNVETSTNDAAWHGEVGKTQPDPPTAKANIPSGQTLAPGLNMGTTVLSAATVLTRALPAQTGQTSGPDEGSPEQAEDGAGAARRLLNKGNSYFYNRILFRTDPGYNPDQAKAQAFAATITGYLQQDRSKDIAQLLQT